MAEEPLEFLPPPRARLDAFLGALRRYIALARELLVQPDGRRRPTPPGVDPIDPRLAMVRATMDLDEAFHALNPDPYWPLRSDLAILWVGLSAFWPAFASAAVRGGFEVRRGRVADPEFAAILRRRGVADPATVGLIYTARDVSHEYLVFPDELDALVRAEALVAAVALEEPATTTPPPPPPRDRDRDRDRRQADALAWWNAGHTWPEVASAFGWKTWQSAQQAVRRYVERCRARGEDVAFREGEPGRRG